MPRYLVQTTVTLTKLYDIEAANDAEAIRIAMQDDRSQLMSFYNPLPHYILSHGGRVEREIHGATTSGSRVKPPLATPPPEPPER